MAEAPPLPPKSLRLNVARLSGFLLLLALLYLQSYRNGMSLYLCTPLIFSAKVMFHGDDFYRVGTERHAVIPWRTGLLLNRFTLEQHRLGRFFGDESTISETQYHWFAHNSTLAVGEELKSCCYTLALYYPLINYTEEFTVTGPWDHELAERLGWLPFLAGIVIVMIFSVVAALVIVTVTGVCLLACCTTVE